MLFPVCWGWFAVVLCLLMGDGVRCECNERDVQIAGGYYTLTKGLDVSSQLIYHCKKNFYPYPALSRLCQFGNKWKPLPSSFFPQRCREVECPDPDVLEYGTVNPAQEKYFANNKTTYECYSGYTQRGSESRVCQSNGKWSGQTPICSRGTEDHCADPGIPAGAIRSGNIFNIGDEVEYMCSSNLFLVGSKKRVCQQNGHWTGIEPTCFYKHTYDTSMEVSEAFGSSLKESLTALKSTVDIPTGRIITIPKESGFLNIYIAVDISNSITKEEITAAKSAVKLLIDKISSFGVSPNYDILFFSAITFEIVNIVTQIGGKKKPLQTILDELDAFEIHEGENIGTNLNLAFSTINERLALLKRQNVTKFDDYYHVLLLFTDGGFNTGGIPGPTVEQIKDLVYKNYRGIPDIEKRYDHLDIYIFGIGASIYDSDLQPLTTGTGGRHYFRLKDLFNLDKAFDKIINQDKVVGRCGLHQTYDTDDKQKIFPWLAYIFTKGETCLGSLISQKFVLTAAHCFKFGVLAEDISLELNSTDRDVKRVILHPKYDINSRQSLGVKEFYDYDVALLELAEDVKLDIYVRPICIPCTQATSDALKLVGVSTCLQQEEQLLNSQYEKMSFLSKGTSLFVKNVEAKRGEARPECIAQALHSPVITAKDPEIAVTKNFLCTGGVSPTVDHIACNGDSGGAVFKNVNRRTIQLALVSWGSQNLCKSGLVDSNATSRDFHINLFRVVPFLEEHLINDDQDDFEPMIFLQSAPADSD